MHQYESCNATWRDESLREVLKVASCGIIVFLEVVYSWNQFEVADFVRRSGVLWQLADAGLIEAGKNVIWDSQKVLFWLQNGIHS